MNNNEILKRVSVALVAVEEEGYNKDI